MTLSRIVLVSLLSLAVSNVNAQDWNWVDVVASGNGNSYALSIASDQNNSLYMTGRFKNNGTFGTAPNNVSSTGFGDRDVYLAKYDLQGVLQWAVRSGGISSDYGYGVSVDADENVFICGHISDVADFSGTTLTSHGGADVFLAKYDSSGVLQWAFSAGDDISETALSVANDLNGNVWIAGWYEDSLQFESTLLSSAGGRDIFVAKFNTNGDLIHAKSFGGIGDEQANGITVDSEGNLLVTGVHEGTMIIGDDTLTANGSLSDIFIIKTDSAGIPEWSFSEGSNVIDIGEKVTTDNANNIYVAGKWAQTGAYAICLDKDGNQVWRNVYNGTGDEAATGVAVLPNGGAFIVGNFTDTINIGGFQLVASNATGDVFVAHFDDAGIPLWAKSSAGFNYVTGFDIELDADGNSYVSGAFRGTSVFDTISFTSVSGTYDAFVAKINPLVVNSVSEVFNDVHMVVFPNPAVDNVNIELNKSLEYANWTLSDLQGRTLANGAINDQQFNVNLDQYQSGMYILMLTVKGKPVFSHRIIKQD